MSAISVERKERSSAVPKGLKSKNKVAVELGRKGGMARAERMSPERRTEIARETGAKRWSK